MNLDWIDIANNESYIDIAIKILGLNESNSAFFEEFMIKAESTGFDKRDAFKFVCLMVSVMGGMQVYLPKEIAFKKLIAHRVLYKEFTGSNTRELAEKYDLSMAAVLRAISACRAADKKARELIKGLD